MNILILGGGGREHALAWAVMQNPKCDKLIVAPGNAGIAKIAECASIDIEDGAATTTFCEENAIDFIIVGPAADPASIKGMASAPAALARIAERRAPFVSRGDDSGTHKAEMRLWHAAGTDPRPGSGRWYLEAGAGMGATLNIAAGRDAYVLADRATWLSFRNRGRLAILVEGDPRLHNPYGVMLVNLARHPHVKRRDGSAFIGWLTGPEGRAAIASFRISGRQVFFPASVQAR